MISPNFPRKTLLFLGSFPVRSWFPSHHLAGLPPSHHMNASGKKPRLEHLGTWNPAPASTHFCTEKFFPDDWCLLVDVGWLVGWLGGWVVGWLVDWLIDSLVGWLIDLIGCVCHVMFSILVVPYTSTFNDTLIPLVGCWCPQCKWLFPK